MHITWMWWVDRERSVFRLTNQFLRWHKKWVQEFCVWWCIEELWFTRMKLLTFFNHIIEQNESFFVISILSHSSEKVKTWSKNFEFALWWKNVQKRRKCSRDKVMGKLTAENVLALRHYLLVSCFLQIYSILLFKLFNSILLASILIVTTTTSPKLFFRVTFHRQNLNCINCCIWIYKFSWEHTYRNTRVACQPDPRVATWSRPL